MYCAIIGDIKASRSIERRHELQIKLNQVLVQINASYADEIKSPFQITLGDEFQGLLVRPDVVMDIVERIKFQLYPHAVRFGVGLGEMYTEVHEMSALGSDGPAYYAARDAIEQLKKARHQYQQVQSDVCILSQNQQDAWLQIINSSLAVCYYLASGWSDKQREIIELVMLQDLTQNEAAERIGIDPSAANRRLAASGYIYYLKTRESINTAFQELWRSMTP